MKTRRAAGYIRVSLVEQTEGHSLDAQRREIDRYCHRLGLSLSGFYADEGVSAHTDQIEKRPQLSALLRDAEQGAFDLVIVHTIDRWARNIRVQSEALQRLGSAGVGFISIAENMDFTTPAGRMMLTMMGGVSEFFSDQLAVHIGKGQRERAESGLPVGPVPFGYTVDESGEAPRIEERHGPAVRNVFARRAAGDTYSAIAECLNRDGFRTRTGRMFTAHAIKDMLNNRFYLGLVAFRGDEFPGRHAPLIDPPLFELVQGRRSRRGVDVVVDGPRGVLAGMIRCARCGNAIHADRNRAGTPLYRERHGWPCETNHRAFVAPPVDAQMRAIFSSIELRPDWRERITRKAAGTSGPSMTVLLERRRRLARAYADGGYTLAEYESLRTALDREIRLVDQRRPVQVEEVADLLRELPTLWSEAESDERRRLIAPLVSDVFVDVQTRRIAGLAAQPPFKLLLDSAMRRAEHYQAVLLTPDETQALLRMDLVETGEN